jgi:hypothetical protein
VLVPPEHNKVVLETGVVNHEKLAFSVSTLCWGSVLVGQLSPDLKEGKAVASGEGIKGRHFTKSHVADYSKIPKIMERWRSGGFRVYLLLPASLTARGGSQGPESKRVGLSTTTYNARFPMVVGQLRKRSGSWESQSPRNLDK